MFKVTAAFTLLLSGLLSTTAFAQSASGPIIFDVRRSLPLEPNEPVAKDFYINAGPEAGFRKGVYISVVRPVPIHDPIQNKQQATLNIPVGSLQVIQVESGITVARLQDELGNGERPTLEFEGVMVGDRIDLSSITTKAPKKSGEKAAETKWFSGEQPKKQTEQVKADAKGETSQAAAAVPAASALRSGTQSTSSSSVAPDANGSQKSDSPPAPDSSAPRPATVPPKSAGQEENPGKDSSPATPGSTKGLVFVPLFQEEMQNEVAPPRSPGIVRLASGTIR